MGGVLSSGRLSWIRGHRQRVAVALVAVAALTICGMSWVVGVDVRRNGMSRPVQRGVAGRLVQNPAELVTHAFGDAVPGGWVHA